MIRFFNHNAEKYPFNLVNNNDIKTCKSNFFYSALFHLVSRKSNRISLRKKIALGKVGFHWVTVKRTEEKFSQAARLRDKRQHES